MADTTRVARALVEWTGNNLRRYVPGTAVVSGRTLTWTEQCKAVCRHEGDVCHSARVALLPAGDVDPTVRESAPAQHRDRP